MRVDSSVVRLHVSADVLEHGIMHFALATIAKAGEAGTLTVDDAASVAREALEVVDRESERRGGHGT